MQQRFMSHSSYTEVGDIKLLANNDVCLKNIRFHISQVHYVDEFIIYQKISNSPYFENKKFRS